MKKSGQIIQRIEELKPLLRDRFNVDSIGIFGSYRRGEENKDSDVDVLVEFTETISLFTFIELEHFLSQELGIKVDLVMKSVLKPRIREGILKEVIYL